MKYYNFYRESDNFDDILDDINVKKYIRTKIRWKQYLTVFIPDRYDDHLRSYIMLKYGDELVNLVVQDFSPVTGVDYVPRKEPTRAHLVTKKK